MYAAVLATIPGLHARPPVLPAAARAGAPALPPPPRAGYDLVLHVGVAGQGPLRVERLGHKLGYNFPDAAGQYAPVVEGARGEAGASSAAEALERGRLALGAEGGGSAGDPVRGFAAGYEPFAGELTTDLDTADLVAHLHKSGVKVRRCHRPRSSRSSHSDFDR